MKDVEDAAQQFIAVFEQLGIPYALMGGLAVRLYGSPRSTFDVDFTIAIDRDKLTKLDEAAEEAGFTPRSTHAKGWVDQVQGMPVIKYQSYVDGKVIDIDIFLAEEGLLREALARRKHSDTGRWSAWFLSVEDLLLLKLLASRFKDRSDIEDILMVHRQLDLAYLRHWAKKLNVSPLLEEALAAAEL